MEGVFQEDENYIYKLEIRQQPQRARMCGLGDKDRRQINPPPCIQLIIIDRLTNQEIPPEKVPNALCYMLIAELWDPKATKNLSIVDTLQDNGPISEAPVEEEEENINEDGNYGGSLGGQYNQEMMGQMSSPENMTLVNRLEDPAPTRNLIGNNVTNAFKLYDEHNKLGIWFVLQDLSIRIEGKFKLKFSLFKLGSTTIFEGSENRDLGMNSHGKCIKILAYKYSDVFQVYSAKKFPGVMDSTPLSKAFAGQGVKISIRREKKSQG